MALDASIQLELWTEAVEYGQKTLPVYQWVKKQMSVYHCLAFSDQ